jgi:hypothetical protein
MLQVDVLMQQSWICNNTDYKYKWQPRFARICCYLVPSICDLRLRNRQTLHAMKRKRTAQAQAQQIGIVLLLLRCRFDRV